MASTQSLRLYLDETGDHSSTDPTDISKRYLGLAGVIFDRSNYDIFSKDLENFKRKHLLYDQDDPPILHRKEIVLAQGAFSPLQDFALRRAFDDDLLQLLAKANYRVVAVVLDKVDHWKKNYRQLKHPYHYCLLAMLERYCGWMKLRSARGDVLAESRGGREDRNLKEAYQSVFLNGGYYLHSSVCQATLSSRQIKIKPKAMNIAGLQLADLLAHPLTRDVLRSYGRLAGYESPYQMEVIKLAQTKYNRQIYSGIIKGYGQVFLN